MKIKYPVSQFVLKPRRAEIYWLKMTLKEEKKDQNPVQWIILHTDLFPLNAYFLHYLLMQSKSIFWVSSMLALL